MNTSTDVLDEQTNSSLLEDSVRGGGVAKSKVKGSSLDRFSPTALGVTTMLVGNWVHKTFGESEQDFLLFMSGFTVMAFAVLIVVLSYVEYWRLNRRLKETLPADPVKVEVGQDLVTGFRLPSINTNPLFQLKVSWVKPTASEYHLELYQGKLHELIRPRRRGQTGTVVREFVLEDLFGFSSIKWQLQQRGDLTVLPKLTQIESLELRRPQDGDDLYDPIGQPQGDLVELRRYAEGDPLRLLLWRVYARNRELIVRAPERALSLKQDLIAYFISHPSDEASASTTRAYLEAGLLGEDYLFYADGCVGPAHTLDEGIIHLLSSAEASPLDALPQLLTLEERRLSGCLIFASALTPLPILLQALDALPNSSTLILSLPLEEDIQPTHQWWARLFKSEETSVIGSLKPAEIRQVVDLIDHLTTTFSPPLLIAHPDGRTMSLEMLRSLLPE